MINKKFDAYLIEEQNIRFERIRNDINQLFIQKSNNLDSKDISNYASVEGIYIEVRDPKNNLVCHSNNKLPRPRRGNMRGYHGMMGSGLGSQGNYREKSFPLLDDDKIMGRLIIGYMDNSHLTEASMVFKDTLSKSFFISAIIAAILGFIISIFLSKGLTNPLISITNTANEIRNGNLGSRSKVKTNTREILQLSQSINYLAQTLENQDNLRKRYASDIAHELRTPLTTLKSHVEAMIDGVWETDEEHLNILMKEIERLNKLVEDLKDSFKNLEGKLSLNRSNFNISNELEDIISEFIPLFKRNNHSLEYSIEKGIQVFMDKDKLKQIMYNLLTNALKYLKHNGKVVVKLCKEKGMVKITVEDNGIGIKEEDIPYIFERFYRADLSRNKETGGTGLGLSITKALVEAHEGSIFVESQYGKGTKFTILLPIIGPPY